MQSVDNYTFTILMATVYDLLVPRHACSIIDGDIIYDTLLSMVLVIIYGIPQPHP